MVTSEVFDLVQECLFDIITKRFPDDVNLLGSKIDGCLSKIKVFAVPDDVIEHDYNDETTGEQFKKNTNIKALVRLRIPLKEAEEDHIDTNEDKKDDKNTDSKTKLAVEKPVEEVA
jgi:hypothetical protein